MQIIFTPLKSANINNGKPYAYVAKNKDTGDDVAYMHINLTPKKPIWANGIGLLWRWGVDINLPTSKPLPAEEIGKLCEVFASLNEAKKWVRDFYLNGSL